MGSSNEQSAWAMRARESPFYIERFFNQHEEHTCKALFGDVFLHRLTISGKLGPQRKVYESPANEYEEFMEAAIITIARHHMLNPSWRQTEPRTELDTTKRLFSRSCGRLMARPSNFQTESFVKPCNACSR